MTPRRLADLVEEIRAVACKADSPYAYQFRYRKDYRAFDREGVPDCELVQVYVTRDGYELIPCDGAGRPLGQRVPEGDGVPFYHGADRGPALPVREKRRRWFRR